jgi:hypothetical protein
MKFLLFALASLFPCVAYAIGEAGDTPWPKGARVEVQLTLTATVDAKGERKIAGELVIKNDSDASLTIQDPENRLTLAFLVFDPLGNPVTPVGRGKSDPAFVTHTLAPKESFVHRLEGLDFVTGSAWLSYDLLPGKTYRVVAVYRPSGPNGNGYTSQEATLVTPK